MYEHRPQIFRGEGQSFAERKAADQARVAREKLLRDAGEFLTDDDLRSIIEEGRRAQAALLGEAALSETVTKRREER